MSRYPGPIAKLLFEPKNLLRDLERQEQYVSQVLAQAKACPNCKHPQNWFAAHRIDINTATYEQALGDIAGSTDRPTTCLRCGRGIAHRLPLAASWYWELLPETAQVPGGTDPAA